MKQMRSSSHAQDARAVLQAAEAAMGVTNVKTIQYSGSGMMAAVGQMYSTNDDWPRFEVPSYIRTIDFDAQSSREEYTRIQGIYPPHGGGGTPLIGEHPQVSCLSGDYAWDVVAGKVVPQMGLYLYGPSNVEYRQLDIIMTPIGFLKAALAPGANPTTISVTLPLHGNPYTGPIDLMRGTVKLVSFTALGKYRVVGVINEENMVELIDTWIGNPAYGDMNFEFRYHDYKDFGGVKYPSILHGHQGDFRLNQAHNSILINVSDLKANVGVPAVSIPAVVRNAHLPIEKVESQKLADGVWLIGGGALNSVAVEFRDFVTVIEAPQNEVRSLAVIDEVSRLIPNKIIRYVVNTHIHWDHCGGLRTYMAQGATIVTSEFNKDYYDRILFNPFPSRIEPDRFSTYYPYFSGDRRLLMELVHSKFVISDGTRSLDVCQVPVPVRFSQVEVSAINYEGTRNRWKFHVVGNLVVYLPKERILVNADLYTPPAKGAPAPAVDNDMKTLLETIKQWKLDVALHVSIEGKEPGSNDQFVQIVGK